MHAKDIMSQPAVTCPVNSTLDHAARLMWEFDCGIIPVVGDDGRLVGVVTDRDACMAAYTQGRLLSDIPVTVAMARNAIACHLGDSVATLESLMKAHQIHRIPILDDDNRVIGLVSMNDLARLASRAHRSGVDRQLVETMAAICQPRCHTRLEEPALIKRAAVAV